MEPLTALIVDDEPAARRDLEQVLSSIEGVKIVAQASDAAAARQLARRLRPSLIFMDIQLPGADGFKALEDIDTAACCVIFTTAYSQFALRAFEIGATDYLLKPVEEARCRQAVERARESLQRNANQPARPTVEVEEHGAHVLVPVDDVLLVTTEGNYLEIRHRRGHGLTRLTLDGFLEKFAAEPFLRVNRQQAVRISHVAGYTGSSQRGIKVLLRDGQDLRVARRRVADVVRQIRRSG